MLGNGLVNQNDVGIDFGVGFWFADHDDVRGDEIFVAKNGFEEGMLRGEFRQLIQVFVLLERRERKSVATGDLLNAPFSRSEMSHSGKTLFDKMIHGLLKLVAKCLSRGFV